MKKVIIRPYVGLNHSKKKIVLSFKNSEINLFSDLVYMFAYSKNKPFININDTIVKISRPTLKKVLSRFIDVGLLKPTKDKKIFKVSKAFMFYGEDRITVK